MSHSSLTGVIGNEAILIYRFSTQGVLTAQAGGSASTPTHTRSSVKECFNSSGALVQLANDIPCFQHDIEASNAARGYFGEAASTNEIRNNTMVGANAGTNTYPDNWALGAGWNSIDDVTEVGIEDGMAFIEIRLSGTPSSQLMDLFFETNSGIAALQNEVWSESLFIKLVAGDLTNIDNIFLRQNEHSSGGTFISGNNSADFQSSVTSSIARLSFTNTLDEATAAFVRPTMRIDSSGGAIDLTIRIYLPQCEEKLFATSVIKTLGSSAVTRNADALSGTLAMTTDSTVVVKGRTPLATSAAAVVMFQWDDGSEDDRITIRQDTDGTIHCVVQSGASEVADLDLGDPGDDVDFAVAMRIKLNDFAASIDGASAVADTGGAIPVSATTVRFCSDSAGANAWNSTIESCQIYDRIFTDTELQAIST